MFPPAFTTGALLNSRTALGDRAISAPEPTSALRPLRIRPVHVTEFSAPNRVRLGIVKVLHEFARWRGGMAKAGYPYFVASPDRFHRIPNRRLARPARWRKVVPNRRGVYRAPTYGGPESVVLEE